MPRPVPLDEQALASRVACMKDWTVRDGKLHRELGFPDFQRAFAFMTRVAAVAERMDHHPDWSNVYGRVTIDLSTHDVGGVTELDFELAGEIERAALEV